MPTQFLDFSDDEEVPKITLKHGVDCEGCKNIRMPSVCHGCDAGEFFEDPDPKGLDFFSTIEVHGE